jgi:hypothetical protein
MLLGRQDKDGKESERVNRVVDVFFFPNNVGHYPRSVVSRFYLIEKVWRNQGIGTTRVWKR